MTVKVVITCSFVNLFCVLYGRPFYELCTFNIVISPFSTGSKNILLMLLFILVVAS